MAKLKHTNWFSGPAFLTDTEDAEETWAKTYDLMDLDRDTEIRPLVATFRTETTQKPKWVHTGLKDSPAGSPSHKPWQCSFAQTRPSPSLQTKMTST